MSQIIFKDQKGLELFNEVQRENAINRQSRLFNQGVEFLNSSNNCKACGHDCSFDIETKIQVPLEKHHVKYFPERIAYVHVECHFAIHHSGLRPDLIEYANGDSREFYANQKNAKSRSRGCAA